MTLTRGQIRLIAGTAATFMALIYFAIGLGIAQIGTATSGESVDLGVFGFGAGTAFLVVALLLAYTDRRWIWILATIFQLFVYVIYFGTAGVREPPFEIWGLALRAIQAPLLVALIYLSIKTPETHLPRRLAR
jgi:hypothetical protein